MRCGRCCHFEIKGQIKKCKYLVKLPSGKTLCRIYKTRLGKVLFQIDKDKRVVCVERVNVNKHYKGCPYNELIKEEKNG